MIPTYTLNEIREKADFVAIASRLTTLKRTGKRWVGNCPFHEDTKSKFTVTPSRGLAGCFICGWEGNVFQFYQKAAGVSFPQAVAAIAATTNTPLPGANEPPDPEREAAAKLLAEEREARRLEEEARLHAEVAEQANERWHAAVEVDIDHAYLTKKGIQAHPIIAESYDFIRQEGDLLLIPMHLVGSHEIINLQTILPSGEKRFLTDGRVSGTCSLLGHPPTATSDTDLTHLHDGPSYITEGFATGVSVFTAARSPVYVAWNTSNLPHVARALDPGRSIVLCADNDRWTRTRRGLYWVTNPGLLAARDIIEELPHIKVAWPEFLNACASTTCKKEDEGPHPTDFNDLELAEGSKRVLRRLVPRSLPDLETVPVNPAPPELVTEPEEHGGPTVDLPYPDAPQEEELEEAEAAVAVATEVPAITVERRGRRSYIIAPFEYRLAIKASGANWDAETKGWWVGSHERAEAIATFLSDPANFTATEEEGGAPDFDDPRPILDPQDPRTSALEFLNRHHTQDGIRTLYRLRGLWYGYESGYYPEFTSDDIHSEVGEFAGSALAAPGVPFKPNTSKCNNIIDALRARTHLNHRKHAAPCWLAPQPSDPAPKRCISFPNGILDTTTGTMHPPTPRFFTHNALSFNYTPNPPEPTRWIQFLHSIWGDDDGHTDDQAIDTLQEIFGYLLLPDTSQQKIFMLMGPTRSGKGTIATVLEHLLGPANYCGPTFSSIANHFGLQSMIGKLVAIFPDARLGHSTDAVLVTERLLSISGEDTLTIDRKHSNDSWTGKLPTRLLILTNELPALLDASSALTRRFIILTLRHSFIDREDHSIKPAVLKELPGIFTWALEGLERLTERGRFENPDSSAELIQQFSELGSPVRAFTTDMCLLDDRFRISTVKLFDAWKQWCKDQGRDHPGTIQGFGRVLGSAHQGQIQRKQGRDEFGKQVGFYYGIRLRDE